MARRKFTREFKGSAVRLVNEQGYRVPDAARNLGIDPGSVRPWLERVSSEAGLAPTGDGALMRARCPSSVPRWVRRTR